MLYIPVRLINSCMGQDCKEIKDFKTTINDSRFTQLLRTCNSHYIEDSIDVFTVSGLCDKCKETAIALHDYRIIPSDSKKVVVVTMEGYRTGALTMAAGRYVRDESGQLYFLKLACPGNWALKLQQERPVMYTKLVGTGTI